MDTAWGYFTFVLAATAISILLHIYLVVTKILDKSPGMIVDWLIHHLTIILQFTIATVEAVQLRNTSKAYETNMNSLDTYNALGVTGTIVDILSKFNAI